MKHMQALFKFQKRATKQFSPLWRSCVACSILFVCGKDLRKSFSPPWRCCEAHANLFV